MDDKIFDNIREVDLKKTMESSYLDYSMSVIVSRALPDVRDGLKPVQRRILYSMSEMNNYPDKPHRKCARIVGDTMGKYHPHGDSSIYGALVNLAQDWNTRYPLVDGHGNFGSVDGDSPAAMRYTEARLSKISLAMIQDIGKDTVDFIPNYDETEKEPVVLPSRYPNLIVNGAQGIAVGMATNIPPHNLREVVDAVVRIIDNKVNEDRDTSIDEIMTIIKGPDFPTGAEILGHKGINDTYRTGRGKIRVRGVTDIEPMPNGKNRIVITELPYYVNKARLIENIADLVKNKKLDGITALRDETSREGMRVAIELRKDVNPQIMLNQLYKHTQLQETYGAIMLALVDNQPKILNLKELLDNYLSFQEEVVTRRTKYDLNKAQERAHILEGLLKALDYIDEVISIIRGSKDVATAKTSLMDRFGLDDIQASNIVEMRLRALTGLERQKLEDEYKSLEEKIKEYQAILGDEKILLGVIRSEILVYKDKYGDNRRTRIVAGGDDELDDEDLIPDDNTVITFTNLGYIKRMSMENFKAQNRGGKGIKGTELLDDDYIRELMMTTNHHNLLFFTNRGRVFRLKAYKIPEASRTARGTAIVNLIQLAGDEKITSTIALREENVEDNEYLFMVTKTGTVKKTRVTDFENINKNGLIAVNLKDGDELITVKKVTDEDDILLFTKFGQSCRFKATDVRPMGRTATGVRGMNLSAGDEIIAMQLASQGDSALIVSEKGLGKCTLLSEFPVKNRGIKGNKCYSVSERTGYLVGVKVVNQNDEVMIINTSGTIIRIKVGETTLQSRYGTGVKLIDLKSDEKVASIAKVRRDYLEEEAEEAAKEEAENASDESDVTSDDTNADKEQEKKDINRLLDRAEQDKKDD
ncbi:MAG: DNA gyrase subunit A [Lachnospiraceae bacterium]|nr:DNA gyrase subunit A [Lachnospiraceae bacterium]MDD7664732.1 DNA gyrase subunit A [Lachnospiraceae bacterium]MDY4165438.1 DNA gyrase subunit A [Lachnospiraceae bacterium]